jgi:S-formylglutathione hydrolase FrmB
MKRALLPVLGVAACGTSASPPPPTVVDPAPAVGGPGGGGAVVDGRFRSDALGVDKRYVVYLPAGYDADLARRYPVVYMLHGLGGDETNWTRLMGLAGAADALALQAIVVMPDGDAGFYANWVREIPRDTCLRAPVAWSDEPRDEFCVERQRYEDYIVRDLVGHVDATYRTIPARAARGIGGLSMGGFGALMLAMRHRDLFASTASHSGVDALLYAGPHPYQAGEVVLADDVSAWGERFEPIGGLVRGIFGSDLATWKAHDPATLAATLDDGDLAIYLDCGTEDGFLLHDGAQYLHDVLRERGVAHEWYLGPGRHDVRFWADRIDDSLRFHAAHLAPPR